MIITDRPMQKTYAGYVDEVISLINIERTFAGLSLLVMDDRLKQAASIR